MSTLIIDGVALPETPYVPDALAAAWAAEAAAERAERNHAGRAYLDAVLNDMRRQGRRTTVAEVVQRALFFIKNPETIDRIRGLDAASSPKEIIAVASMHLDQAREQPQRWFGMGGETSAINCRGAILYARWLRRVFAAAERAVPFLPSTPAAM